MSPDMQAMVDAIWESHGAMLQPALDHDGGLHTLESVKQRLDAGSAQIWPGERSVIVTELVDYPAGRAINFWLAAGELPEITAMTERLCSWAAADEGCIKARMFGRPGWARVAGDAWRQAATVLERSLA